jgi:hypothetical protein
MITATPKFDYGEETSFKVSGAGCSVSSRGPGSSVSGSTVLDLAQQMASTLEVNGESGT